MDRFHQPFISVESILKFRDKNRVKKNKDNSMRRVHKWIDWFGQCKFSFNFNRKKSKGKLNNDTIFNEFIENADFDYNEL